jgi:type IV pilus assembly protein PilB
MRKKLGECLIQAGLITEDELQSALAEHKRTGERLGAVLVRMKLTTEKQIAKALAYQLGFQHLSLVDNPPDPAAVVLVPKDIAIKRACVAVKLEKNVLTLAMADPLLFSLVQDLEFKTGYRIKQVIATQSEILEAVERYYPDRAIARSSAPSVPAAVRTSAATTPSPSTPGTESSSAIAAMRMEPAFEAPDALRESGDTAPIVDLVDLIVKSAVRSRASDVHIEPLEKTVVVRHRLDGLLKEVMDVPKWVHEGLVARLKIMAGMDIAEKRLPQDGRIRMTVDDETDVDFRVSTLRTLFGEKIVLRVLDHRKGVPALDELGLSATALEDVRRFLKHQHGMILVVGPTGSGKTTTLCSALTALQSERTNIVTIEDPIEYQIPGINQTQVNEKIRLNFAGSLRSILRQDPDVILVGEIRDLETARIAMQAAQTGHLVLSSLHTDDAPSAVTRLVDIGIEPYVAGSALIGIVAQRLVRRLCTKCRQHYTPSADTLRALNITEAEASAVPFYHAVGCEQCNHTGYRGRIGVYEVMHVGPKLRRLIAQHAAEDTIRDAGMQAGMVTLGEDGLAKMKIGLTTPDELVRVITEVRELRTVCPGCACAVSLEFVACPQCGRKLTGGCPRCGRGLQQGWNFCPYCATNAASPGKRLRKGRESREQPRELPAPNIAEFRKS